MYLSLPFAIVLALYIVKRKLAIESLKKYLPKEDRKLIVDNLWIKIPVNDHDPKDIKQTKIELNRYLTVIAYFAFLIGILGLTYIAFFKEI